MKITAGAPFGNQNARKDGVNKQVGAALASGAHNQYVAGKIKEQGGTSVAFAYGDDKQGALDHQKEGADAKWKPTAITHQEEGGPKTHWVVPAKAADKLVGNKDFAKLSQTTKATDMNILGTDVVHAHGADELTLNDLQSAVSAQAKSDSRFNVGSDGKTKGDYYPWCADILRDEDVDEWSAVINGADGSYYKVPFTIDEDNGSVTLGTEATKVSRRTAYVSATEASKQFCYNGEIVKAGGPGSGRTSEGGPKLDPHERVMMAAHSAHFTDAHDRAEEASEMAENADFKARIKDDSREAQTDAANAHAEAAVAHMHASTAAGNAGEENHKDDHLAKSMQHEVQARTFSKRAATMSIKSTDKKEVFIVHCRDTGIPIVLAAGKEWKFGEPTDFQWMPGGLNNITAGTVINGEDRAVDLWLDCNEATAKTVKASFAAAVKRSPRRPPFGCVEHHEEEKAFEPQDFLWKDDPEPGVYCTAKPTGLGETNVNKRLHTSFSPSFGTDADYTKAQCRDCDNLLHGKDACTCGGTVYFPDGVKGSESNPAIVRAVSPKSVGSLTNWPAFKNILPVTAKEPGKAGTKPLTAMEKIYAQEAEKGKLLAEIRAKNCAPEAPKNPVMEKLYAANGMNS